jgi:tRNA (Thr-GGU) A37 N-methylase
MNINLKQIATINSPFCSLVNMPVQPKGVLSTRTPMDPNSLGLSIVELVSVDKDIVTVKGIDILDGTPLLDIKPYIENFDKIETDVKSGWMNSSLDEVKMKKSDDRFV